MVSGYTPLKVRDSAGRADERVPGGGTLEDGDGVALAVNNCLVTSAQKTPPVAEATRTNAVARTVVASLFMISLLALGLSAENSKQLHLLQAQVAKQDIFEACTDSATFRDALGNPCDHYKRNFAANKNGCKPYGSREDMRGTGGQLVSEACCASCGVPKGVCTTDSATFRDGLGNPCDHYARNYAAKKNGCAPYGSREDMRGTGGQLVSEACCASCGVPSTEEIIKPKFQSSVGVMGCTDSEKWRDALGNSCDHYARNYAANKNGCAPYGFREDMRGKELKWLPAEACCASCGTPSGSPEKIVQLGLHDCGGTHVHFERLNRNWLPIGEDTALTAFGTVDEELNDGKFTLSVTHISPMHIPTGAFTMVFEGKLCTKKEFEVVGIGTFTWRGLKCPVHPGNIGVEADVQMASWLTASLAESNITLTATGSSAKDKLLCKTITTRPQAQP